MSQSASGPVAGSATSGSATGRAGRLGVAVLLLLHVVLLLHAASRDSATFDEPLFLAGGIASWEGGHHLFPEGGALPQRLEGLPLVLAGATLPRSDAKWQRADSYGLGFDLLYRTGHDPRLLLFLARLPVILVSLLFALVVHGIARRLFGSGSALIALSLYALNPLVLAHAGLATADLLAALTLLGAAWLAHRCLQALTWTSILLSCAATAAAFLAKMSAMLLPLIVLIIVVMRLLAGSPLIVTLGQRRVIRHRGAWVTVVSAVAIAHAVVVVAALWFAYDLRWSANPPDATVSAKDGGWATVEGVGALAPLVNVARDAHLLPEAWIFGLQFTLKHAAARRAYAEGHYSLGGWWWFFPRAVGLKMPLAALALMPLGLFAFTAAWRRRARLTALSDGESDADAPTAAWARTPQGRDLLALAPLLALFGLYWAVALASNLNIGVRHMLPTLPIAFILAAAAWRWADGAARRRVLVGACAVLAALEGVSSHPDHLAWMNVAAGPASQRWTHLVDSSLDWGQGLHAAAEAVKEEVRPGEPVYLSYFGMADPASEGLQVHGLAGYADRWRVPGTVVPGPGIYVVSATQLVQLMSHTCPGRWRPLYENWYAEAMATADPPGGLARRDDLIAGRLCAWLRQREPLRVIAGGAMLMYRLDADDVHEALIGPPAELATGEPVPFPIVPYEAPAAKH